MAKHGFDFATLWNASNNFIGSATGVHLYEMRDPEVVMLVETMHGIAEDNPDLVGADTLLRTIPDEEMA